MPSKRLFVAIEPDETLVSLVNEFMNVNSHLQMLRWVKQELLHTTACFIGDTDVEDLPIIIEKIADIQQHFMPVLLKNPVFCLAPPDSIPNMLWLQFESCDCFKRLSFSLSKSLLNCKPEYEPIPHVTVARFRGLPSYIHGLNTLVPYNCEYSNLVLYESVLTKQGAKYLQIKSYK